MFDKAHINYEAVLMYLSKIDSDLFNLSFIAPLISNLKKNTNLFNIKKINCFEDLSYVKNPIEFIKDCISAFYGEVSIMLLEPDTTDLYNIALQQTHTDISRNLQLTSDILNSEIAYSYLDEEYIEHELYRVIQDKTKYMVLDEYKFKGSIEEKEVYYYEIDLISLVERGIIGFDVFGIEYIVEIFDYIYEIDRLVKKSQKIYSQKSDLDLF